MIYIIMGITTMLLTFVATHSFQLKQQKKVCIALSIIVPVLVSTFRYDNGSDYLMYAQIFREIKTYGEVITGSVKSLEIGFIALVKVLSWIDANELMFFFVTSLLIVYFYIKGIWKISSDILLSVLLFFVMGVYFDSFNGIRQFIAMAICFYAIQYIYEKNLKKYIIVVIIGSLFHYTTLIMIPIYFFARLRLKLWNSIVIVVGTFIGGSAIYSFVTYLLAFTRYRYFLTSIEYEAVPTSAAVLYTVIIFVCSIYIIYINDRNITISEKQNVLYNFCVLACVSALLSYTIPLAMRIQGYFIPILMLWIPELVSLGKKKITRKILRDFIIILFVAIVVIYGIINNNWYTCYPYNFYFNYK